MLEIGYKMQITEYQLWYGHGGFKGTAATNYFSYWLFNQSINNIRNLQKD